MGGKLVSAYGKIKVTIRKYIATLLTVVARVMRTGILKQNKCEGEKMSKFRQSFVFCLLRVTGSLSLVPAETLFQSGDKEEVEIRGCSIWCCALICKHLQELYQKKGQDMHEKINAVLLDYYLWDYARDHREEMKDIPFHRVRCIYY